MRLIVNADDFGLTLGVSRAILKGMKDGIVTDTSALVTAPGFEGSVVLAREAGIGEMGLHVLLTVGHPALPAAQVPTLVNEQGRFYTRPQFLEHNISLSEVEAEIEAQILRLEQSGLRLNHIDCHHGLMNATQGMRDLFIDLAVRHGVPLRNEASRYCPLEIQRQYLERGVRMPEHFYLNHHGVPTHKVEHIQAHLSQAREQYELVEIGCHPGYNDGELEELSPLNQDREIEMSVVMDQELKRWIQDEKINLVSFGEAFEEVQ